MSSQRIITRIFLSAVALVLLLFLSIRIISASPAEAKEASLITSQADQIAVLTEQVEILTQLVEQLSDKSEHVLVLRIDQDCFGGAATVQSLFLQVPVDQRFFDSCNIGDDVTDSSWITLMTSSFLTETRVYVENKFLITR